MRPIACAIVFLALAAPGRAQEAEDPEAWAAGIRWLEAERARLEAEGPRRNEAGPPRLVALDSEAIRWAFPRHRFYRIETPLEYYKPGLLWAGSLYALPAGTPEPVVLRAPGRTSVDEAERSLLSLDGRAALAAEEDAIRFLAAVEGVISWFERPVVVRRAERTGSAWRLAADDGSPAVVIELDEECRAVAIRRE